MEYVADPGRHPDRQRLQTHLAQCTECALAANDLLSLHDAVRADLGWRGTILYLRGAHPNRHRFESHLKRCAGCRLLVGALRPCYFPVVRGPALGWTTSAVLAAVLFSVSVKQPDHVRKGDGVHIDRAATLDARGVATYLEQFSRSDLTSEQVEELKQLTNQLESRLYGADRLEEDPAYLLTLAGLFQCRYESTREERALKARQELLDRAQKILADGR